MSRIRSRALQTGLSLIELLVALTISLIIVIATAAFFLSSSNSRNTQDAAGVLQDNARFATEIITRNIQQAGFQNYQWGTTAASFRREVRPPTDGPDLRGFNNSAAGSDTDFTGSSWGHNLSSNRVNNSDALVIRFQGSGTGSGDGSMIDCMGRPWPQPTVVGDRVFSIFEVYQSASTAEPELRCKYGNTSGGLTAEPLVRGVEMLQFMYGIDSNGDSLGVVDRWLNAADVTTAQWPLVRSVRVGMVLRSPDRVAVASTSSGTVTLSPLGTNFSQNNSTYPDALVIANSDGRLRKVVTFTVNLRNAL